MKFPNHKSGLFLAHNEHKIYYESIVDFIKSYDDKDWISTEQKTKAIETDELWSLQWYPDNPIGFVFCC